MQEELDILPDQCLEFYDVIIVTSTMAADFIAKYKEVKWSRIIIDEVLSIKLPQDIPWQANFIWFITATPSGLAYIKKLYIREIFYNLQKIVFNYLVIKNNMTYTIEVRNNNVEKALRVLKKKLLKDGVMKELRERQYFSKPSLKKREKKKENIRRLKKEQKLKVLKGEL